jgi:hypothetical protein
MQGNKLAFWLSKEIALRAAMLRDVFEPAPASNAIGELFGNRGACIEKLPDPLNPLHHPS